MEQAKLIVRVREAFADPAPAPYQRLKILLQLRAEAEGCQRMGPNGGAAAASSDEADEVIKQIDAALRTMGIEPNDHIEGPARSSLK